MPKIHIRDDVYEKLKELSEEQNRSISNMAETILLNVWGKQPMSKAFVTEELKDPTEGLIREEKIASEPTARTKDAILKDIWKREAQLKDDLEYCQDNETRRKLEEAAKHDLDALWAEYNYLKED